MFEQQSFSEIMNFYVVFGVLATLALHSIIAEETKEAAPATTAAASDRVGSGTKSAYDGCTYTVFFLYEF